MKKRVMVLLLATGLSAAAAAQEAPPDIKADATMCNSAAYALCIKAPCSKKLDENGFTQCECIMQSGFNLGPNSCADRAKNLTSTYANNFNAYSATVSCPRGTAWAWCYGAKCEPDPNDPSKAICKCPVKTKLPTVILVNRELCGQPDKVCDMIWSGAVPGESKFANEHFHAWMTDAGMIALPPASPCPAPR